MAATAACRGDALRLTAKRAASTLLFPLILQTHALGPLQWCKTCWERPWAETAEAKIFCGECKRRVTKIRQGSKLHTGKSRVWAERSRQFAILESHSRAS